MKEVTLPSGAKLKISLASFDEGKELYQAVLEELRHVKIDGNTELDYNFMKDLFCVALSSKKVEVAMWKCLKRCLYNGVNISNASFEPVEARQDYFEVMFEVGQENLLPFSKSLYSRLSPILEKVRSSLA